MHHREPRRLPEWLLFLGQLLAWAVVIGVVLVFVTSCKSTEPDHGPVKNDGPTFVREPLHGCRCGERIPQTIMPTES